MRFNIFLHKFNLTYFLILIHDVKFRYLNALASIRASNKDLAFSELEKCLEMDPRNIECYVLKGKLFWSVDRIEDGNQCFW